MPAKRLAERVGVLVRGNPYPLGVPVLGVLCAKSPALVFQHGTRVHMLHVHVHAHMCVLHGRLYYIHTCLHRS